MSIDRAVTAQQRDLTCYLCPTCGIDDFEVIRLANYDDGLSDADYAALFHSSSDAPLTDQLCRCRSCDLIQTNPRLNTDLVSEGYSEAIDPTHMDQDRDRIKTFARALRKVRRKSSVSLPLTGARALDIGCASGAFLQAAQTQEHWQGTGVEPSKWLVEQGRSHYGLNLVAGYFNADMFPEDSFDVVTMWDVIEHVPEPQKVLQDIRKVLKPGGVLILNVPDNDSLMCRTLGFRWPFYLAVHIYYFTPASLRRLLDKNDFELVDYFPFSQTLGLGYVINRGIGAVGVKLRLPRKLQRTLDRVPLRYRMGQTTFVARPR